LAGKGKKKVLSFTREEQNNAILFGHNFVRSKKSRDVDNGTTRGLTKDFGRMWVDPSRSDFEGIDTVVKLDFPAFTKAKGKKAFDKMTNIFGESGF